MNYLGEILHRYSPTFAALASLREIFRVSGAALTRWVNSDCHFYSQALGSPVPSRHFKLKRFRSDGEDRAGCSTHHLFGHAA